VWIIGGLLHSGVSGRSAALTVDVHHLAPAAPEIIEKKSYTNAIDCWSLGVVLFIMYARLLVHDAGSALLSAIKSPVRVAVLTPPLFFHRLSGYMPFSEDLKEAGPLTEQILQVCDACM
jgi:hypothetical protein